MEQSVAEILSVKEKSKKLTTLATTFFIFSSFPSKSSCQHGTNMHKIENKSLWKEEMSYGGDTVLGKIWVECVKS